MVKDGLLWTHSIPILQTINNILKIKSCNDSQPFLKQLKNTHDSEKVMWHFLGNL